MTEIPEAELPVFDDAVERVVVLARKGTRKAARLANRVGFFVEHAEGACIVKSPRHVLKVPLKASLIDVNKQYTFSSAAR
jgi:hypothetical protein